MDQRNQKFNIFAGASLFCMFVIYCCPYFQADLGPKVYLRNETLDGIVVGWRERQPPIVGPDLFSVEITDWRQTLEPGYVREWLGFSTSCHPMIEIENGKEISTGRFYEYFIPLWFMLMLTAVVPIWWLNNHLKYRRRCFRLANGLCPRCGYDVRASGERCSECGFIL